MKQAVKSLIEKLRPSDLSPGKGPGRVVQASREDTASSSSCQAVMSNMLTELRDFDKRIDQKLTAVCQAERQGA